MARSGFLTVDGESSGPIPGDVVVAGYEGAMEVYGFHHEVLAVQDPATGLPVGNRQHRPLTVIKAIDKATPLLLGAMAQGERLTDVLLEIVTTAADGSVVPAYTIALRNAQVVAHRTEQLNNQYEANLNLVPLERVSFAYDRLTVRWEPDGIEATDTVAGGRA